MLADAFSTHEERARRRVDQDTWGHLAPEPRRKYPGWMVFARTAYGGEVVLIDADFEGLDDSPWLYDDLLAYAEARAQEGVVSLFRGTYRRFKNGNGQFSGQTRAFSRPSRTLTIPVPQPSSGHRVGA